MIIESPPTAAETLRTVAERTAAPVGGASQRPLSVIVGAGLLTPLGRTAEETWDALLAGKFITDHARAAGEFDGSAPRVIQMARRAADEALVDAGWRDLDYATVVGTSKGSVESWLDEPGSLAEKGVGIAGLGDIAGSLGGRGPRITVSAACASGLLALGRGLMMIRAGEARRVLVVAAEASVHPLFLGSFRRLGVLPRQGVGCRPFDERREGFLMSEAAAAVCLEARDDSGVSGGYGHGGADHAARVVVTEFAMAGDGAHLTAGDPDGRVLRYLINKVSLGRGAIDLVHAHGTGTVANDPVELAAIEAELPKGRPTANLYSHKGGLGHSLGAAGLVAVVVNTLCHARGVVPPNVRTRRPIEHGEAIEIAPAARHRPVRRSIALAAGFGGAMAAVGLATPDRD